MIHGIMNVYKEAGYTSHDVVAKLRGIAGQKKIGHTGTLDPAAVGVLPVCLGCGTKLCDLLTDEGKEYETELLLGVETDTQDLTGTILVEREVTCTPVQAEQAILEFVGDYDQIPPMYSALKVGGRKLYELARAGREVDRAARRVKIHEIRILSVELPRIRMTVKCSKGTYIRTLCHDIGRKLCCGGTMASLKRTAVGRFTIADALTLGQLEERKLQGKLEDVVTPVDAFFMDLPQVIIKENYRGLVDNGNRFEPEQAQMAVSLETDTLVRVYGKEAIFRGIYEYCAGEQLFKPYKMFLQQ